MKTKNIPAGSLTGKLMELVKWQTYLIVALKDLADYKSMLERGVFPKHIVASARNKNARADNIRQYVDELVISCSQTITMQEAEIEKLKKSIYP